MVGSAHPTENEIMTAQSRIPEEPHDVSRPGERTDIDIDMTRAVIIDPTTEKII